MRRLALLSALFLLAGCAGVHQAAAPSDSAVPAAPKTAAPQAAFPSPIVGSWPPDAVPWQLNVAQLPEREVEQPRPVARTCTAADLPATADYVGHDGASGTQLHYIEVPNAGPTRCSLAGVPVLLSAGKTVPTVIDPGNLTSGVAEERPATIDPGERAQFTIGSSLTCDGGAHDRAYRDISVRLADRELEIPGLTMSSTCPIGITGVRRLLHDMPAHPHFDHLTARIEAPARVKAGTNLDYTVTLTNLGKTDVVLDPCPVYEETLYKGGDIYLLNCAPGTIPAGRSIRFAMRLTVPDYTPAQDWKLEWAIHEWLSNAPTASATVTVY